MQVPPQFGYRHKYKHTENSRNESHYIKFDEHAGATQ